MRIEGKAGIKKVPKGRKKRKAGQSAEREKGGGGSEGEGRV